MLLNCGSATWLFGPGKQFVARPQVEQDREALRGLLRGRIGLLMFEKQRSELGEGRAWFAQRI